MMKRWISSLLAVALLATATQSGQAADEVVSPLSAIPAKAGVVVRLKAPSQTIRKLTAFATEVDPQMGPMLGLMAGGVGAAISNPTQGGLDPAGDWWMAIMFAGGDAEPTILYAVPTQDIDAAKEATVGGDFSFVEHKNWLFYSEDENATGAVEGVLNGKGKSISTVIDAASQKAFDNGDLAAFVNIAELTKVYAPELKNAKSELELQIQSLTDVIPDTPGMNTEAIVKLSNQMFKAVFQGLDDTLSATIALKVRTSGLTIEEYASFKPGSKTNKFFSRNATSTMALLNKLPEGQLGYFGMHGDAKGMMKWGMELAKTMMEGNEEATKLFEGMTSAYDDITIGSYVGSFNLVNSKNDGVVRATIAAEMTPTGKVKEMTRKFSANSNGVQVGGATSKMTLQKDAEEVAGQKIDIITVKNEVDENVDPLGIQKEIQEAMFGPEGVKTRVAYLPKHMVQSIGGNSDDMKAALTSLQKDGDSSKKNAIVAARSRLSKDANIVGLLDLASAARDGLAIFAERQPELMPIAPEVIKGIQLEKSYFGFSMAAEKTGVRVRVHIPAKQIKSLVQIGKQIQSMMQAPQL